MAAHMLISKAIEYPFVDLFPFEASHLASIVALSFISRALEILKMIPKVSALPVCLGLLRSDRACDEISLILRCVSMIHQDIAYIISHYGRVSLLEFFEVSDYVS